MSHWANLADVWMQKLGIKKMQITEMTGKDTHQIIYALIQSDLQQ